MSEGPAGSKFITCLSEGTFYYGIIICHESRGILC